MSGFFNDDLSVASPATRVTAAWLNDVQENLMSVLGAAGVAPIKGEAGQLLDAIYALIIGYANRTGTVIQVLGTVVWPGYLKLDGAEYAKADYPALVAHLTAEGLLVDGSDAASFVLPDARGYASRNWDDGAGVDPGRVIGSLQGDALGSHSHSLPSNSANGTGNGSVEDTDAAGTSRTAETGLTGGAETRMKNIALMFLIKT